MWLYETIKSMIFASYFTYIYFDITMNDGRLSRVQILQCSSNLFVILLINRLKRERLNDIQYLSHDHYSSFQRPRRLNKHNLERTKMKYIICYEITLSVSELLCNASQLIYFLRIIKISIIIEFKLLTHWCPFVQSPNQSL